MKKIAILIISIFTFLSCNKTDKEILNKTISKLNSLETIEYELENENFIKSFAKKTKDTASCYIDFTSKDTLIGAKYQFVSKFTQEFLRAGIFLSQRTCRLLDNKRPRPDTR